VDGAVDYLRYLGTDTNGDGMNQYEAAWAAVLRGDPQAFVRGLHVAHYFATELEEYRETYLDLLALFQLDHRVPIHPAAANPLPAVPVVEDDPLEHVAYPEPLLHKVRALLADTRVDWDAYIEARDAEIAADP
jgi:hypothetical protein